MNRRTGLLLIILAAALVVLLGLIWLIKDAGEAKPDATTAPDTASPVLNDGSSVSSGIKERPEYPDIFTPAPGMDNSEEPVATADGVVYPGSGDLDETGAALPPYEPFPPTSLPIYQNETQSEDNS